MDLKNRIQTFMVNEPFKTYMIVIDAVLGVFALNVIIGWLW